MYRIKSVPSIWGYNNDWAGVWDHPWGTIVWERLAKYADAANLGYMPIPPPLPPGGGPGGGAGSSGGPGGGADGGPGGSAHSSGIGSSSSFSGASTQGVR